MKSMESLSDFQVIVRNNVMLSNISSDIKIHISYCNGLGIQKMVNSDGLDAYLDSKYIDWIAIKAEEKCINDDNQKIHRTPDVSKIMYMGTANMLPIMAVDLMFHSSQRIYICGNNLFLTNKPHAKDYVHQPNMETIRNSFVVHNLFSQHCLLKQLFDNGLIKTDEELGNVLSISTLEYAEAMEKLY